MALNRVDDRPNWGYPGQILTPNFQSIRGAYVRNIYKDTPILKYGYVVTRDTDGRIMLPTLSTQKPAGVTVFDQWESQARLYSANGTDEQGFKTLDDVPLLTGGGCDLVVWSASATTVDQPACYVFNVPVSNPLGYELGMFTATDDADTVLYANCRFTRTTSGAGLTTISIGGF
jgi:hypothetical protein